MAEETDVNAGNAEEAPVNATETAEVNNAENSGGETVNNSTDSETSKGEENNESKSENVPSKINFDELKLPEGVTVSDEEKTQLSQYMERFGITTQEGLQSFIDWALESSKEVGDKISANNEKRAADEKKEWEDIKSGWKTSLEGDADFGKDYDLNMKRANEAMEKFGGSELAKWLSDMDVKGNPALVKTFARIGKEFEDAKLITGTKTTENFQRKTDRYNQPMFTYNE